MLNVYKPSALRIWLLRVGLIISLLLSEFYNARGIIFLLEQGVAADYSMIGGVTVFVQVFIYIVTAAFAWGIFEMLSMMIRRYMRLPRQTVTRLFEQFIIFYIAANICVFVLRLFYFYFPTVALFCEAVAVPIILYGGFLMFYFGLCKLNKIPVPLRGRVLSAIIFPYFGINLILTVVTIISIVAV